MRPVLESCVARYFAGDLLALGNALGRALGGSRHDPVVLRCMGGVDDAAIYLGLLAAGLTPLLMRPLAPLPQVLEMADRLGAPLVTAADFTLELAAAQRGAHSIDAERTARRHLMEAISNSFINCHTSGTSGYPTLVRHSVATAIENARAHLESVSAKKGAVFLTFLPISFSFQCLTLVFSAVACGGTLYISPDADFYRLSESLKKLRPDFVNFTPALFRSYCRSQGIFALSTVGCVTVGGAQITLQEIDLLKRINDIGGTRVCVTYGATECGPRISTARIIAGLNYPEGVIGNPIRGVELKQSPEGVLMVKSAYMGSRIIDGQAEAIRICRRDDWYVTGDTGYQGGSNYVVTGRAGRVIERKDTKIVPEDIESKACRMPGIHASLVRVERILGIEHVVCYYQCETSGLVQPADLRAHILSHVPASQAPTRFCEVPEGITTDTGKLALQKDFSEGGMHA